MNLYKVEFKYDDSLGGRRGRTRHVIAYDTTGIENILRLNYSALSIIRVELVEESILTGAHVKAEP